MTEEERKKISLSKLKYKKLYCDEILQYFYDGVNTRGRNGMMLKVPSYVGFALKIGVSVRSIQIWRKKYPDFGEACDNCDALLIATLDSDSVTFKAHANYVKFLLSSRFGIKEKIEVTHDNDTVEVPKEVAELLAKRKEREDSEDDKT